MRGHIGIWLDAQLQSAHLRADHRDVLHWLGVDVYPVYHHHIPRRRVPQTERLGDCLVESLQMLDRRDWYRSSSSSYRRHQRGLGIHDHDRCNDCIYGLACTADGVWDAMEDQEGDERGGKGGCHVEWQRHKLLETHRGIFCRDSFGW